jgi:nucleotide-binding universal stress UspA family protein
MTAAVHGTQERPESPTDIFDRIVCGVDASEAGWEALRQARRLLRPDGELVAVTVHDPTPAVHAGWAASAIAEELAAEARAASAAAAAELSDIPGGRTRCIEGHPAQCLLKAVADERATLLVVGTHGRSRVAGILLGRVATTVLHEAACPVLLARPPADAGCFPRAIAVGVDGSPMSLEAARVADEIAERFAVHVRRVVATGGKPVDLDALAPLRGLEWHERPPVEVLVHASADADLLVIGSRGLHGFAALGSVSERVGHRASSSVLVVRPASAAV